MCCWLEIAVPCAGLVEFGWVVCNGVTQLIIRGLTKLTIEYILLNGT